MARVLRMLLLAALVVGVSAGAAAPARASSVAFGVNTADAPGRDGASLDAFTAKTGQAPAIVMWYQSFDEPLFYSVQMPVVDSRGAVPMITWEPAGLSLEQIARGDRDAYLRQAAADAKRWGKPFYVRFAHEMNGGWYSWGAGVGGNTPAGYIAAWRHVVRIFRDAGATNVKWVWSPNTFGWGASRFESFYPGDAWVDWVALDGYNFGATKGSGWRSFGTIFQASYDALAALTTKPMMIAETGSGETGGDKAAWLLQGLLTDLPQHMPRIRAIVWFDRDKDADWRVDSSAATLIAFRAVLAASLLHLDRAALLSVGAQPAAGQLPAPVSAPSRTTVKAPAAIPVRPVHPAPKPTRAYRAPAPAAARTLRLVAVAARAAKRRLHVKARLGGSCPRGCSASVEVTGRHVRLKRRMVRRGAGFALTVRVRGRGRARYRVVLKDRRGRVVARSSSRRVTLR